MGIKNGVFSLQRVNRIQDDGQWSTDADVYLTPSPFRGSTWSKAYWCGGDDTEGYRQRFDFASDTTTMTIAAYHPSVRTMNWVVERGAGAGNANYGFIAGGDAATPGGTTYAGSLVQRIDYANDEDNSTYRGILTVGVRYNTAVGTQDHGYFCGGINSVYAPSPIYYSTISRITYANDSNAVAKGNLNNGVTAGAATGNQSYGYFGGGSSNVPSPTAKRTWVDRIDYSNDTATATPKGPLLVVRQLPGCTGNASYGYWAGGASEPSTVATTDRVDYSNDTATATPKGALSTPTYAIAATGTASYGYFGGGKSPSNCTTNDRLDYSSDTSAMVPKGQLVHATAYSQAVGAQCWGMTTGTIQNNPDTIIRNEGGGSPETSMHGYWLCNPGSTVSRLDFTNDTQNCSPKGDLIKTEHYMGATGNANHGY